MNKLYFEKFENCVKTLFISLSITCITTPMAIKKYVFIKAFLSILRLIIPV